MYKRLCLTLRPMIQFIDVVRTLMQHDVYDNSIATQILTLFGDSRNLHTLTYCATTHAEHTPSFLHAALG